MEGSSGGPQQGPRRISSHPPAPAQAPRDGHVQFLKRIMHPPMLELPPDLRMNYDSLNKEVEEHGHSDKYVRAIHRAYTVADHIHQGEFRKGEFKGKKEPYIVHPINVAIRVTRKGAFAPAVCAALLHDTIEDTHKAGEAREVAPIHPSDIEAIFNGAPVAPAFARRVSQLVVLLTKPKFSERNEWIFAGDPRYYEVKDCYNDSLYDQRSDVYYDKLLDSGDMEALLIKLCDNLHNAETMFGITDEMRQKNFRTMANKSLGIARLILTREEFDYVASQFEMWGYKLPPTVDRAPPSDILVHFPLRTQISGEALRTHPDPAFAYVSIYGSVYDAFLTGIVEVGLPQDLGINYRLELERHLPASLFCEQVRSMVPRPFAMHEVMFRISGFGRKELTSSAPAQDELGQFLLLGMKAEHRLKYTPAEMQYRGVMLPSKLNGFVDILDESGEVVRQLPESTFTQETRSLLKEFQKEFETIRAEYDAIADALRKIFSEVVAPVLQRMQPPSATPPNPASSE